MTEGTVLCFDFGLARTGVAVGNTLTRTAEPQTNDARWKAIEALVAEWDPALFVVGVPVHGDGTDSTITQRCRRFARQLEGRFRRPAKEVDERYSSVEADDGSGRIDDLAAEVILRQYFEENAD